MLHNIYDYSLGFTTVVRTPTQSMKDLCSNVWGILFMFLSFRDSLKLPRVCRLLRSNTERFFERNLVIGDGAYFPSAILSATYCVVSPRCVVFSSYYKKFLIDDQLFKITMSNTGYYTFSIAHRPDVYVREMLDRLQGEGRLLR